MSLSIKGLYATLGINGISITTICHYAECHYAECFYAECHYAIKRLFIEILNKGTEIGKHFSRTTMNSEILTEMFL
jgi:hypothetical protein